MAMLASSSATAQESPPTSQPAPTTSGLEEKLEMFTQIVVNHRRAGVKEDDPNYQRNLKFKEALEAEIALQPPTDFRIRPGDTVDIGIMDLFDEGEVTLLHRQVSANGMINLPAVPLVKAAGLTRPELRARVVDAYKPNVLRNPDITVSMTQWQTPPAPQDPWIRHGDIVDVSVLDLFHEGQETVLRRQVSRTGMIDLPMVDPVKAAGLTDEELCDRIIETYAKTGLKDSMVTVMVVQKQGTVFTGKADGQDKTDKIIVEDLALAMLAAIRDKDDAALKNLAADRMKQRDNTDESRFITWPEALPQFAVEIRERFQQMTGKPFEMRIGESGVAGEVAAVKCVGPEELNGIVLILFFVKTDGGWKNLSLRNAPSSLPMEKLLEIAAMQAEANPPPGYYLESGDVVDISILDLHHKGLETVLRRQIPPNGMIDLPKVAPIMASGLTATQLRDRIIKSYSPEILPNPTVSVAVVSQNRDTPSISPPRTINPPDEPPPVAPGTRTESRVLTWPTLEEKGKLLYGHIQPVGSVPGSVAPAGTTEARQALRVSNAESDPTRFPLVVLDGLSPTTSTFAVEGQMKYLNVEGDADLEMLAIFPDGKRVAIRLEEKITGTSDWRPFSLPVTMSEPLPRHVTLEMTLFMPGTGIIDISPLRIVNLSPDLFRERSYWWTGQTAGWISILQGIPVVLLIVLFVRLVRKPAPYKLVRGVLDTLLVLGTVYLAACVVAMIQDQPYFVYFPLICMATATCAFAGLNRLRLRRYYQEIELRKMRAMDIQ